MIPLGAPGTMAVFIAPPDFWIARRHSCTFQSTSSPRSSGWPRLLVGRLMIVKSSSALIFSCVTAPCTKPFQASDSSVTQFPLQRAQKVSCCRSIAILNGVFASLGSGLIGELEIRPFLFLTASSSWTLVTAAFAASIIDGSNVDDRGPAIIKLNWKIVQPGNFYLLNVCPDNDCQNWQFFPPANISHHTVYWGYIISMGKCFTLFMLDRPCHRLYCILYNRQDTFQVCTNKNSKVTLTSMFPWVGDIFICYLVAYKYIPFTFPTCLIVYLLFYSLSLSNTFMAEGCGHAKHLVKSYNLSQIDGIVVSSGDGLIHEVSFFILHMQSIN